MRLPKVGTEAGSLVVMFAFKNKIGIFFGRHIVAALTKYTNILHVVKQNKKDRKNVKVNLCATTNKQTRKAAKESNILQMKDN